MFDFQPSNHQDLGVTTRGPTPLQQSDLFAKAVHRMGGTVGYHCLNGQGAFVLARKFPLFGRTALISRGPSHLDAFVAEAIKRLPGTHVIVNAESGDHAAALSQAGFWRIAADRSIAEVALIASKEAQAARLHGKWRNRLRHAKRQGVSIVRKPLPPDPNFWLFHAEAQAARDLRYQPLPPQLVTAMALVDPGALQVFEAKRGRERLAAMLFVRHGESATYLTGWSAEEGRRLSAGNLLMWTAMRALQRLGCVQIDLGSCDRTQNPGLARFKLGTGAIERRLGGTWLHSRYLPPRPRPFWISRPR